MQALNHNMTKDMFKQPQAFFQARNQFIPKGMLVVDNMGKDFSNEK